MKFHPYGQKSLVDLPEDACVKDLRNIAHFNRIIKNYTKMNKIKSKTDNTCYVTWRSAILTPTAIGIPQKRYVRKAIQCPDQKAMMSCYFDIMSYAAAKYVRTLTRTKPRKDIKLYTWKQYNEKEYSL